MALLERSFFDLYLFGLPHTWSFDQMNIREKSHCINFSLKIFRVSHGNDAQLSASEIRLTACFCLISVNHLSKLRTLI